MFEPLFFTGTDGSLYGVHHSPESSAALNHGILIVPPFGQDYVRCHKVLQKLSIDLAKVGFDVLRFDYTGTGDSTDATDWSLDSWINDSKLALDQLATLAGARKLSLIGLRLGGGIATSIDAAIDQLVLWDPIGEGAEYLAELDQLHHELCNSRIYFRKPRGPSASASDELLGHAMPAALRDSIAQFSLIASIRAQPQTTLWIDAEPSSYGANYAAFDDKMTGTVQQQIIGLTCNWAAIPELENLLMGQPAARIILKHFTTVAASQGTPV